ncbi:MAG: hypothetical protein QMC70_05375, partial [Bacteroidia bacterium]
MPVQFANALRGATLKSTIPVYVCSSTPSPVPVVLDGEHREGSVAQRGVISLIPSSDRFTVLDEPLVQRTVILPAPFSEIPRQSLYHF